MCQYENQISIKSITNLDINLEERNHCVEGFGYSDFDNPNHHSIIKQVFTLRKQEQFFIDERIRSIRKNSNQILLLGFMSVRVILRHIGMEKTTFLLNITP